MKHHWLVAMLLFCVGAQCTSTKLRHSASAAFSDRTRIILSIDPQNIVIFGNIIYNIFVLHFEVRNVGYKALY
jgi:hypothetical protein